MHRFLRAVGFSDIDNRQSKDKLLGHVMSNPNINKQLELPNKNKYTELSMEFAPHTGITVRGEYDRLGFFHLEHFFPYCESTIVTSSTDVTINKRVDTSAYTAMCDDSRLGLSLIFYLQNSLDYLQLGYEDNTPHKAKITLSGLSPDGMIILGLERSEESKYKKKYEQGVKKQLFMRAKNGDPDAMDSLTINELDLSARVSRRIQREDLYSIVETSFFPYGSESDNYMIIGTIMNWSKIENSYTGETVCQLLLNCNDIVMNVCINEKDLMGEPMIGRRFKGMIWMQGHVDFTQV